MYTEFGEDILGAIDKQTALIAEFDVVILLDAITDALLANVSDSQQQFECDVLAHALKEIRKSRGMED